MSKNSARLLSGASSIAIVTALSLTPAVAGQTFGPGAEPPIVISADTDFVHVTGATVAADGEGNAFVIQSGATVAATLISAVTFTDSTFVGSVVNSGRILTDNGNAWAMKSDEIIGNVENNGFVIGGGGTLGDGLTIIETKITGGISNTQTFQGGAGDGLSIVGSSVSEDISNSGTMAGGTGAFTNDGLRIVNSDVLGAIRNNDGGVMRGGASVGDAAGLNINSDSVVAEGIFNDGTIAGGTAGLNRAGIFVEDSDIGGGIHNNDGGTITGSFGISIRDDSLVTGGIVNNATGSIIGRGNAGIAINDNTVFSGGISNHGWLTGGEGGVGITVFESTFSGGIHNFAGGSIVGDGAEAIVIGFSTVYTGGLLNEGHIDAVDATAVTIGAGNFSGAVDNAGLISSNVTGIRVTGLIGDGILNSGTIEAPTAIDINGALAGQTITQTSGKILGDIVFSQVGESFFVGKGGYFQGDMIGSLASNDDVTVISGTWSAEGTGTGLGDILVTGGTGVFGGRFYGDLAGTGFDIDDSRAFGTTAGRAYIDDDSNINVGDINLGGEGSLEFLLTSDIAVHGRVTAELFATLNGRLATYLDWNSFAGKGATQDFGYSNVVQSSNDLIGAFLNEDDVDTNSVFFEATATQRDDRYVDINVHRIGFDEAVSNPTANQQAIGDSLEEIFADGGAPFLALEDPNEDGIENPQETSEGLFSALFQLAAAGDVADAYGSLDGHNNAAIFQTTFTIAGLMDRNIQARVDQVHGNQAGARWSGEPVRYAAATIVAVDAASSAARPSSGWSAWARAFGSWGNGNGDAQNEGFDQDSHGVGMGVDYTPNDRTLIGLAGQFASTDLEFDRPSWALRGADANIDSWQVALYGNHSFGRFFIDGNASATFNDYTAHRVDFWGQPIASAFDSTVYSVYGELGADLGSGRFNFQPFAGVGFRHADIDNFTERCPLFCLAIKPEDAESLYSAVGVRVAATYKWGRTPIIPEVRLAWQHEFSDDRGAFDAAFVGAPGSPFHVEGQSLSDDRVIVGAGVSAEVAHNFTLFAEYNGTFSGDYDAHSIAGGLRVTW